MITVGCLSPPSGWDLSLHVEHAPILWRKQDLMWNYCVTYIMCVHINVEIIIRKPIKLMMGRVRSWRGFHLSACTAGHLLILSLSIRCRPVGDRQGWLELKQQPIAQSISFIISRPGQTKYYKNWTQVNMQILPPKMQCVAEGSLREDLFPLEQTYIYITHTVIPGGDVLWACNLLLLVARVGLDGKITKYSALSTVYSVPRHELVDLLFFNS